MKHLNKLDIPLDESIELCYNYIHNIGYVTISDVVRHLEIYNFLKNCTNYSTLLSQYDTYTAAECIK